MSLVPRTVYTGLVTILLPFVLIRMGLRNLNDKTGQRKAGPRSRLFERFGILRTPPQQTGGIVFHAVSVGESLAAMELIRRFIDANPGIPITLTCSTQAASKIITERFGNAIYHCYLPYDHPFFIALFLQKLQPKLLVLIETGMWPNLIHGCFSRGIKQILLNARLSKKSYDGYRRMSFLFHPLLNLFSRVCCQTQQDAQRFIDLGLSEEKFLVAGNLKFDIQVAPTVYENSRSFKEALFLSRPCWICASSHEGEDEILLNAHRFLLEDYPQLVLILAARRPQRSQEIASLSSQMGFGTVRRTENRKIMNSESVFILDTIGELMDFYALSKVCFIGGSLTKTGGHNPLEPAILSKPILSGKNVENFRQVYEGLRKEGAVKFVENATDIAECTKRLLDDPELALSYSKKAESYVLANRGVSQISIQLINDVGGF